MKDIPLKQAGSALAWKAIQLSGVKAIFFLRLLVLARLLVPEDFGLLAIAATAIGFLMQLTNLGMVPALIQGKDVSPQQYNTAWTVGVARSLLVTVSVAVAAPFIAQLFSEARAIPIIQVLALRPLLDALSSIKVADLTRQLQFRPLAMLKLVEAVANTVISIILAQFLGVWAMVIGTIAGSTAYLIFSYILAPHRAWLSFNWTATRPLIQFGRWIFITGLIAMAGGHVLRLVISRQLGIAELGLYFLAAQLAFLPAELASEVVGEVAFPLFARLQTDLQKITRVFRALIVGISALLFPVCALIIVLAPALVQFVLGDQWVGTVPVIRILTTATMIGLFGEVAGPVFKGLGQPFRVTITQTSQSLLLIVFVWILTTHFGLVGAALAWLPAIANSQVINMLFLRQLLPRPLTGLGSPMLAIICATSLGAIAALAIEKAFSGFVGLVLSTLAVMFIIGGALWISDRRFSLGLVNDMGLAFPKLAGFLGYSSPDG